MRARRDGGAAPDISPQSRTPGPGCRTAPRPEADTQGIADALIDRSAVYGSKHPKAAACLVEDREVLLTHFGFLAEQRWRKLNGVEVLPSVRAADRYVSCRSVNVVCEGAHVGPTAKCDAPPWSNSP